jgi:hypothetical protein
MADAFNETLGASGSCKGTCDVCAAGPLSYEMLDLTPEAIQLCDYLESDLFSLHLPHLPVPSLLPSPSCLSPGQYQPSISQQA